MDITLDKSSIRIQTNWIVKMIAKIGINYELSSLYKQMKNLDYISSQIGNLLYEYSNKYVYSFTLVS